MVDRCECVIRGYAWAEKTQLVRLVHRPNLADRRLWGGCLPGDREGSATVTAGQAVWGRCHACIIACENYMSIEAPSD